MVWTRGLVKHPAADWAFQPVEEHIRWHIEPEAEADTAAGSGWQSGQPAPEVARERMEAGDERRKTSLASVEVLMSLKRSRRTWGKPLGPEP